MNLRAGFKKKISNIDQPLSRLLKKKIERIQTDKSQMKEDRSQPTPQKYKQLSEITIKNYMPKIVVYIHNGVLHGNEKE